VADENKKNKNDKLERDGVPHWYVAHTYSGYENRVKQDIEFSIKSRKLENYIFEIRVPTQIVTELVKGKEKKSEKKLFPGYVLVNMILTNDTWYVVRNTRGVTGFVGPDSSEPVPISEDEMLAIMGEEKEVIVNFEVGKSVIVTSGSWKDSVGKIISINDAKRTITIGVELFGGSETPVEVGFGEVKKL
jgi:transcriptional antiterminator NusG